MVSETGRLVHHYRIPVSNLKVSADTVIITYLTINKTVIVHL